MEKLPPNLIITINRFEYDKELQEKFKVCEKVDIPFEFSWKNVFPTLKINEREGCEYKLNGFIVHLGK